MQLKYGIKSFSVNSFRLFPDRVKIWVSTEIWQKIAAVILLKARNYPYEAEKSKNAETNKNPKIFELLFFDWFQRTTKFQEVL